MSIILLTGRPGSGKTSLAKALFEATGWRRAGFGDYVRGHCRAHGFGEDRANLQRVGQQLVERDAAAFCKEFLAWSGWTSGSNLIVDGLRHAAVLNEFRKLADEQICLVFVEAPDHVRQRRLLDRGERQLADSADEPTEREVGSILRERADLVLNGTQPPAQTAINLIAKLGKRAQKL